jgi:hypothetical protein
MFCSEIHRKLRLYILTDIEKNTSSTVKLILYNKEKYHLSMVSNCPSSVYTTHDHERYLTVNMFMLSRCRF